MTRAEVFYELATVYESRLVLGEGGVYLLCRDGELPTTVSSDVADALLPYLQERLDPHVLNARLYYVWKED